MSNEDDLSIGCCIVPNLLRYIVMYITPQVTQWRIPAAARVEPIGLLVKA
jgi:hypothetical protein